MVITKDEDLLVSQAVGYMFKVIKAGKNIINFKEQFNAIKHGDYDCFFTLIKEPQPELLFQWKEGSLKSSGYSQQSGDCDITMLFAIDPSLRKFCVDCFNYYGKINDSDITDLVFSKCAAFEIALRVQSNKEKQNRKIHYTKSTLEKTIDELCVYNNIPPNERNILQDGRRFVNMVKGHKSHFTTWHSGILSFELAWSVCGKYQLKIC